MTVPSVSRIIVPAPEGAELASEVQVAAGLRSWLESRIAERAKQRLRLGIMVLSGAVLDISVARFGCQVSRDIMME